MADVIRTVSDNAAFLSAASFANTFDCVGQAANLRIQLSSSFTPVGVVIGAGSSNDDYKVIVEPAPNLGHKSLANTGAYNYGSAGIELTSNSDSALLIRNGVWVQGVRLTSNVFHGMGAQSGGSGVRPRFIDCKMRSEAWGAFYIQAYQTLEVFSCLVTRSVASGGPLLEGNWCLNGFFNTWVLLPGATASEAHSGGWGSSNGSVLESNLYVNFASCFSGDFYAVNNYSNSGTQTGVSSVSNIVVNTSNDFRPGTGALGKGSADMISTNDGRGNNRGGTPDAGAVQANPAEALAVATITAQTFNNGSLTLSGTYTNNATGGLLIVDPVSRVNGVLRQTTSTFSINSGNKTFSVTLSGMPREVYRIPDMRLSNSGGLGPKATGGSTITSYPAIVSTPQALPSILQPNVWQPAWASSDNPADRKVEHRRNGTVLATYSELGDMMGPDQRYGGTQFAILPGDEILVYPAKYYKAVWFGMPSGGAGGSSSPLMGVTIRGLTVNGQRPAIWWAYHGENGAYGYASGNGQIFGTGTVYISNCGDGCVWDNIDIIGAGAWTGKALVYCNNSTPGTITFRNMRIMGNYVNGHNGFLSAAGTKCALIFENVESGFNGGGATSPPDINEALAHGYYITRHDPDANGNYPLISFKGCFFHHAWFGHQLKVRNPNLVVEGCYFMGVNSKSFDDPALPAMWRMPQSGPAPSTNDAAEVSQLDMPNGGKLTFRNNILVKNYTGRDVGLFLLNWGAESDISWSGGEAGVDGEIIIENNTFVAMSNKVRIENSSGSAVPPVPLGFSNGASAPYLDSWPHARVPTTIRNNVYAGFVDGAWREPTAQILSIDQINLPGRDGGVPFCPKISEGSVGSNGGQGRPIYANRTTWGVRTDTNKGAVGTFQTNMAASGNPQGLALMTPFRNTDALALAGNANGAITYPLQYEWRATGSTPITVDSGTTGTPDPGGGDPGSGGGGADTGIPPSNFTVAQTWSFNTGTEGWANFGIGTFDTSNGDLRVYSNGTDPYFQISGLNISGSANTKVLARVKRQAGSAWEGGLRWLRSSDGTWDDVKYKQISDTTNTSGYVTLEWDLSAMSNWTGGTITGLRLDLGQSGADQFLVNWIVVGAPSTNVPSHSWEYLRIRVLANNGDGYCGFAELEASLTPGGANIIPSTAQANQSSYYNDNASDLAAYKLVNGNDVFPDGWVAFFPTSYPQWVTFGLGSQRTLSEIRILPQDFDQGGLNRAPRTIEIQGLNGVYTTNDAAWTTYKTFSNVTGYEVGLFKTLPLDGDELVGTPGANVPGIPMAGGDGTLDINSSSIEATGDVILLNFGQVLGHVIPDSSCMTLSGGRNCSIDVPFGGMQVALYNISPPYASNDTIFVTYTPPAINPLQNVDGSLLVPGFTNLSVVNTSTVDAATPQLSGGSVNSTGDIITLSFNPVVAHVIPDSTAFVLPAGRDCQVDVNGSGQVSLYNITPPLTALDNILIDYNRPGANPLQDAVGRMVPSFASFFITNTVAAVTPVVTSIVTDATGGVVTINFNTIIAHIIPDSSAFTLSGGRNFSVDIGDNTSFVALYNVSPRYSIGDVITLSYTQPGTNNLQEPTGLLLANFSNSPVTNNANTTATIPSIISAQIADTGDSIDLFSSELLAHIIPDSATMTLSGDRLFNIDVVFASNQITLYGVTPPYTADDVITVSYTVPEVRPFQTDAGALMPSFTNVAVPNTVPGVPPKIDLARIDSTGTVITLLFDSLMGAVVPATSAFTLTGSPTFSVRVNDGTKEVQLYNISPAYTNTSSIKVTYLVPALNPLQGRHQNLALAFVNFNVPNTVPAPTPAGQTVLYGTDNTTNFLNPERGFVVNMLYGADFSAGSLQQYKNQGISLIWYTSYLKTYKTRPLDTAYFDSLQVQWNLIRASKMKIVLRVAYTDEDTVDATLVQMQQHMDQFRPYLLANADIVVGFQCGMVGRWGEFQGSTNFGADAWPTSLTTQQRADRKAIIDKVLSVLPDNKWVQTRQPYIKMQFYRAKPVADLEAFDGSSISRIGHFNDFFLGSSNDAGTYYQQSSEETFLEQDTRWVPMGGETAAVNSPRSDGPSAIVEMSRFHWSFLNIGYNTDVYDRWKLSGHFDEIARRLGYRLRLASATMPTGLVPGTSATFQFNVVNDGFAAPFAPRTVKLVLRNGALVVKINLKADWRKWLPGATLIVTEIVAIPISMPVGTYEVLLEFPDHYPSLAGDPLYSARLANIGMWEPTTGFNKLSANATVGTPAPVDPPIPTTPPPTTSGYVMPTPSTNPVPTGFAFDGDYVSWLSAENVPRCLLVEVTVESGGSNTTLYLSSSGYVTTPFDTPANTAYLPLLSNGVSFAEKLTVDSADLSYGDIELNNTSGELDPYLNYVWVNKRINIYSGDVRWGRSDFQLIFTGVVADIDSSSRTSLNIKLRDKLQRLNTPLTDVKVGGTTQNKEMLVPLVFGEVFNMAPVLIDPALHTYQFHQRRANHVIEVRDNGAPVVVVADPYDGKFQLSGSPAGAITCSVQGDMAGGVWPVTVATIIKTMVTSFGKASDRFTLADIDLSNFDAFDAANPQPVGYCASDSVSVLQACQELARTCGAQLVCNRFGLLQLVKLQIPGLGTPFAINPSHMLNQTLNIAGRTEVQAAVKLGYCKNWTVQPGLNTGILEEHKARFAVEWDTKTVTNSAAAIKYSLDKEPDQRDTMFLRASEAEVEANRLLNIMSVPRTIYEFNGLPACQSLYMGQAVTLTHGRYGLESGKAGVVVGLNPNWITGRVVVQILV